MYLYFKVIQLFSLDNVITNSVSSHVARLLMELLIVQPLSVNGPYVEAVSLSWLTGTDSISTP